MAVETLCLQCSMRALVEQRDPPIFHETPEEHLARVHPDPEACLRERQELEAKLVELMPLLLARTKGKH